MSIKIDTELLETDIMFLKNDMNEVDIILDNIRQATEKIDGIWSSNEADKVKQELKALYPKYEEISNSNKNINDFLDKIVVGEYTAFDSDISKLIDEKISVE